MHMLQLVSQFLRNICLLLCSIVVSSTEKTSYEGPEALRVKLLFWIYPSLLLFLLGIRQTSFHDIWWHLKVLRKVFNSLPMFQSQSFAGRLNENVVLCCGVLWSTFPSAGFLWYLWSILFLLLFPYQSTEKCCYHLGGSLVTQRTCFPSVQNPLPALCSRKVPDSGRIA